MATQLNLKNIVFQFNLRSKPVRQNFEDIQTTVNAIINEILTLSASTSTSEIIASRDDFDTLDERLHVTQAIFGNGVIATEKEIVDCDEITDLPTVSTDAITPTVNTTPAEFVEGTGSLNLGKSGTSSTQMYYETTSFNVNMENRNVRLSFFIRNVTSLGKISEFNIYLTPDSNFTTNYKKWNRASELHTNWNHIDIEINSPDSITGTVANDADLINMRIEVVTNNSSDTIPIGDFVIDYINYYGGELRVIEQDTPDMTVKIQAGNAVINGYGIKNNADINSTTITAPSSNPRWDLAVLDINGVLRIYAGDENASPTVPDVPFQNIRLAKIYHRVGSTSIKNTDDSTNSFIVDLRTFVSRNQGFFTNNNEITLGVINIYPVVSYDVNDLITSIDYKLGGSSGITIATATYTYSGEYVTQVVTAFGAVTYTTVYTYDGSNEITNIVTTKT